MAFPHDGVKFQEGESGNPNGRPVGQNFKSVINRILDLQAQTKIKDSEGLKAIVGDTTKLTNREAAMLLMFAKAVQNPEGKGMERILERAEGKAIQPTDNKHTFESPLIINDTDNDPAIKDNLPNHKAEGGE